MVVIESRISCGVCNAAITKESSSGQKDYNNTRTMALECKHWKWHCYEVANQGWLFGGNAYIKITLYATCLRCGQDRDTWSSFWGWPNNDHVHNEIKCYTCNFKLNFYSYSVGHWALIAIKYGVGGAIGMLTGGVAGAAIGALVSKSVIDVVTYEGVLGYNSMVGNKISIKTNIEDFKLYSGWQVKKFRRYSNPLAPNSVSNAKKLDNKLSAFINEGAKYLGMKTQHEWIVAECVYKNGGKNYILILWQSVKDKHIKFDKYDTLNAAAYSGIFWMISVNPHSLDHDELNKYVNWIEYKSAKNNTYVWDVYELIGKVFSNGRYQLSVNVPSKDDKESLGNCQTLCQFVINEFGDKNLSFRFD